jgi:hypothetical protein
MFRRSKAKEGSQVLRSVDIETGIRLLEQQVEKGKILLEKKKVKPGDHAAWNEATRECLTKIYGPSSPNLQTLVHAPGMNPVWLGMSDDVHQRYISSSIEHKIERLNSCITSLKAKS